MGAPVELNVSEPWFSAIRSRSKTVEGRLNKGKFATMEPGTVLVISKSQAGGASLSTTKNGRSKSKTSAVSKLVAVVTKVVTYSSFVEYLSHEGLAAALPGVRTIEDGVAVYRQFYTSEMERQHGVLAIHIILM